MIDETFSYTNANSSTLSPDEIHISMNHYDFYMSKPTILDKSTGTSLPINNYHLVPVIRVYGCLPTGHQVLCHIHGIFPYLFIRYDGADSDTSSVMNQKCAQLHMQLESGARNYYSKDSQVKQNSHALGNLHHIANVSVVKGVPFYGYHVGWYSFYKISLLHPSHVNKVSDLLREGILLKKAVKTYESHIPYLLQFSADFNLFGCDWITLNKCYFRKPVLNDILDIDNVMMTDALDAFLKEFCNSEKLQLDKGSFPRIGNGLLEVDIIPQFIRNIDHLSFRDIANNFPQAGDSALFSSVKYYVESTKKMVRELTSQRTLFSLEEYQQPNEIKRDKPMGDNWQLSPEYSKAYLKAKEDMKLYANKPRFENFIKNDERFEYIPSAHTALTELWPQIPTSLSSQQADPKTDMILNDSIHELGIPNESDDDSDANDNHKEYVNKINEIPTFDDQLLETAIIPELEKSAGPDNDKDNEPPFQRPSSINSDFSSTWKDKKHSQSMDYQFTQQMTRLKKPSQERPSQIFTQAISQNSVNLGISYGKGAFLYKKPQFNFSNIEENLSEDGHPIIEYQDIHYGNPRDYQQKPYVYAGKRFDIHSDHLIGRIPVTFDDEPILLENISSENLFETWKYDKVPPKYSDVRENSKMNRSSNLPLKSQITFGSNTSKVNYKFKSLSPNKKAKEKKNIQDTLTHLSLEIHVNTRDLLKPDPSKDEVCFIVWKLDDNTYPLDMDIATEGILIVHSDTNDTLRERRLNDAAGSTLLSFYESEFDMLDALTDLILFFDPDILSGYEVNLASWGYIMQRSQKIHHFNLAEEISRVSLKWKSKKFEKKSRQYTHSSGTSVTGRYVFNIWRLMRSNVALTQYSIENLAFQLLHERIPHYTHQDLTNMWNSTSSISYQKTVFNYWLTRVRINVELLRKEDFIDKTMEQARLIGIDFHSVYFRGSQYKVESFLIRMCKSENFMLVSPTKTDVQNQRALECVPLVMEPESAFYKSPMVVLDFQSLYPSVIMAYNYCYSTMVGRVRDLKLNNNIIGVDSVSLKKGMLDLLNDYVTISPNGVIFVKPHIRQSILSRMLKEILDIRVMVKKTISELGPGNEALKKSLSNKQLALKLLANVTYGYTSASFSGRMPCADLADSVVQTGRETLEKAIKIIESKQEWGAKVVYGDTDSLFIYLPGKSKDEAFNIGNAMSLAVSQANPDPIFLKFEKVYFPSILVSKKRYVGYAYEWPGQREPKFDAKGIETVRRDGHPAQQKIIEQALRILFETKDVSKVKGYVQSQFSKIHSGKVSIQDFCFAKEVKLGKYKSESTAPAGAVVAKRQMENDKRAEPQYKERIPYLVVKSTVGKPLRDRSMSPEEYMKNELLELDAEYYINKTLIPPLGRLLNIAGIDVAQWDTGLKRVRKGLKEIKGSKIKLLGNSVMCCNCRKNRIHDDVSNLCLTCLENSKHTVVNLLQNIEEREKEHHDIRMICRACSYRYSNDPSVAGDDIGSGCSSYDCPIYYSKMKNIKVLKSDDFIKQRKALKYLDKW